MLRTSNPEATEQVRLSSSPSREFSVFRNVQHEELHLVQGSHAWKLLDPSMVSTRAKIAINSQARKNLHFLAESPLAMNLFNDSDFVYH